MVIGPRPAGLLENLRRWASEAEGAGIDLIGTGEAPHLFHDPYVLFGQVARETRRALVGPVITTPHYRHPATLATTMSTLQELSGGRAFLGIGIGDGGFLAGIGERPTRLNELVEYALTVKALAAGERVSWRGKELQLAGSGAELPTWFAAEGRRTLQAAGEFADGAIIGNGATPELVRFARENIAEGAKRSGRSIDDLDVWFLVRIRVSEAEGHGADELAFYAARWVVHALSNTAAAQARGFRIEGDLAERIGGYLSEYSLEQAYVPGSRSNVELLEKHELKDWATRQFLVTGSMSQIVGRLQGLLEAGARNIIAVQMLSDYLEHTKAAAGVWSALRASRDASEPAGLAGP
jgi:alkanesulfonate monooxygenase SsuD/methylene tetrahydromethanopterin reductase-like flavin-dependent oxidoreductase (luciferase family)